MTTVSIPARRQRFQMSQAQWRALFKGLLFISPAIIGLLVFVAWPMVQSLYYSFTDYNALQAPKWVGWANYDRMLKDRLFGIGLRNTLYMVAIALPIHIIFDLAMAFLLNTKIRGLALYRTIFYIPSITPVVASAIAWMWIFNGQFGILNAILQTFGLQSVGWLASPEWIKPSLIFMGAWFGGNTILIYLAGLQDVPVELLEAAELDGAGAWRKTWSVTLPMISPVIFYTIIISIIGYFQYFTEAWVLTATREGAAGGPGNAALFYSMYLYQNAFQRFRMGYASAQAWALFVIILIVTGLLFFSARYWVHYQGNTN